VNGFSDESFVNLQELDSDAHYQITILKQKKDRSGDGVQNL